jgi:ATP-dependent DNA helicase 2 subunit 2
MDTNKKPQVLLLAPWFGENLDLEALVDVPLPFAEDVRIYKFPPLDRVITSSGASLLKHRFLLPSDELEEAMSGYIDKMDLSAFGKDDEGYD